MHIRIKTDIWRYYTNLKKNELYCLCKLNGRIKIYLISLKNCKISRFNIGFNNYKHIKIGEIYQIKFKDVFYLDYSEIFILKYILQINKKFYYFMLLYKFDKDKVKLISQKYVSEKTSICDIKEINKNENIILLYYRGKYIIHKNDKNIFLNRSELVNLNPRVGIEDDEFEEIEEELEEELEEDDIYYHNKKKENKKCKKKSKKFQYKKYYYKNKKIYKRKNTNKDINYLSKNR